MTPAPPLPFPPIHRLILPRGSILHRIHQASRAADGFNPGLGRPSRFAPMNWPDGSCTPTAYAADTLECAVHETVFHDIPHDAARKTIDLDAVRRLAHAEIELGRHLALACLFEPDLNHWGLTRGQLIDTHASHYAATRDWALAIHAADPSLDGLIWTSRRCDPDRAMLLFGDRVRPSDLLVRASRPVVGTPGLLLNIRAFGKRAGTTLVM